MLTRRYGPCFGATFRALLPGKRIHHPGAGRRNRDNCHTARNPPRTALQRRWTAGTRIWFQLRWIRASEAALIRCGLGQLPNSDKTPSKGPEDRSANASPEGLASGSHRRSPPASNHGPWEGHRARRELQSAAHSLGRLKGTQPEFLHSPVCDRSVFSSPWVGRRPMICRFLAPDAGCTHSSTP